MKEIMTKTGDNVGDMIAHSIMDCHIKIVDPTFAGGETYLRGQILAYKKLLELLGFKSVISVKIEALK